MDRDSGTTRPSERLRSAAETASRWLGGLSMAPGEERVQAEQVRAGLEDALTEHAVALAVPTRPRLGEVELLVYGECAADGWRCAMPEGSRWPRCAICGEQVLPDGLTAGAPPRSPILEGTGESGRALLKREHERDYRRREGTGYIALYVPEIKAAELLMVARQRQEPGDKLTQHDFDEIREALRWTREVDIDVDHAWGTPFGYVARVDGRWVQITREAFERVGSEGEGVHGGGDQ